MKLILQNNPIRLQIAVYGTLVAEVVVENLNEADRIWAKWAVNRYHRNKPMGGAAMYSSENTRLWDVPVGSLIQPIDFHQTSE